MYTIILNDAEMLKEGTKLVSTPENVYDAVKDFATKTQEHFLVLTLDTKNNLLGIHLVSLGTLNSSLVHPREVFRVAILDNAAAMILAHNHPSGDPTPSAEDIKITKQLVSAGEIMGIKVLDHLIIGREIPHRRNKFLSLREAGLLNFN